VGVFNTSGACACLLLCISFQCLLFPIVWVRSKGTVFIKMHFCMPESVAVLQMIWNNLNTQFCININRTIIIRWCILCKFTSAFLYRGERVFVDGRSKSSALCPECAHVGTMSWNWLRVSVALFGPFLQMSREYTCSSFKLEHDCHLQQQTATAISTFQSIDPFLLTVPPNSVQYELVNIT